MNQILTSFALASVATLAPVAAQVAVNDVFNRPDSNNLGPDWALVGGSGARISGNQLRVQASNYSWMIHTDYSAPYASTVARCDFTVASAGGNQFALILGASFGPTSWGGIEVRVCDHTGDGRADRVLFNAAPNAGNWPGTGGVYNLTNPMSAGTMTVWCSANGDVVHCELRDATTGVTETGSATGILSFPFAITGTGVGIGYQIDGLLDDLQVWTGQPGDVPFTLTTPRVGLPASFLVTGATPSSAAGMFASLTGAGPLPTPVGLLQLSLPVYALAAVVTDASGRAELPIGAMPPFPGLPLYLQALDAGTLTLTNGFVATIR